MKKLKQKKYTHDMTIPGYNTALTIYPVINA